MMVRDRVSRGVKKAVRALKSAMKPRKTRKQISLVDDAGQTVCSSLAMARACRVSSDSETSESTLGGCHPADLDLFSSLACSAPVESHDCQSSPLNPECGSETKQRETEQFCQKATPISSQKPLGTTTDCDTVTGDLTAGCSVLL